MTFVCKHGREWPVKGALWDHQQDALHRSIEMAPFSFQFDAGLGKTLTVIAEAGRMFLDGEIDTLVIDAPNRVHRQWLEKQFRRWADFPYQGIFWEQTTLTTKRRSEAFERTLRILKTKPALRVFCFNFESLRLGPSVRGKPGKRSKGLDALKRIFSTSRLGVYTCVDESHRIKDHTSQQTRAALTFGRGTSKVRRTLTGTPVLQGVQDLYSQYAFLDPLIIGQENFFTFRSTYCKTRAVPGRPNAAIIVGPKNEDALMRRIAPFTARVLDTEVLDMPPRNFDTFEVEMEPAQARAYEQMDELMMTMLRTEKTPDGVPVTASIALTQIQKLQQICCGFVFDEHRTAHWISDSKMDAIREKVEDLALPHIVIWAPFIPVLERLEHVFGGKATRYRQLSDVDEWTKKGGPLIANPASGGTGVDGMQVAHWALYAANSFSLEHRSQSIKRTHRGDQKSPCFYLDFVSVISDLGGAKQTRDATVIKVLDAKRDIGTMTVDRLREFFLK